MRRVLRVVALGALVASATIAPGGASTSGRDGIPRFNHVFVVVMENLDYGPAMSTPGIARIASRWAVATNYYGVSHPSLPNYLALAAGSTFGVASDCVTCYITAPNLFGQLAAAGDSYDAFFEGVPSSCFLGPWGGTGYASKHNPFRYFNDVRASTSICSHLQPLSRLAPLLKGPAKSVPQFVWVTPDLCHDGHDCSPTTAAAWLAPFVNSVTASKALIIRRGANEQDHFIRLVHAQSVSADRKLATTI